ncbi:hypothetical protein L2E82_30366 [Cichorium intybus]|uniref:Uncharacterized protein n=1 Tax=Cichorium intybus TaxID=13427 RepID=A0ACB9D062_CICIN|nr:hypothetical protein L2E82_30366 [Cichorium intybus]
MLHRHGLGGVKNTKQARNQAIDPLSSLYFVGLAGDVWDRSNLQLDFVDDPGAILENMNYSMLFSKLDVWAFLLTCKTENRFISVKMVLDIMDPWWSEYLQLHNYGGFTEKNTVNIRKRHSKHAICWKIKYFIMRFCSIVRDSFTEADDILKLHDIVHCSLDVVDERGDLIPLES